MDPLSKECYTVEEYLSWGENVRAELYEGMLIMLAQPTARHQSVLGEIFVQLHAFLKGKSCKAYVAPLGVKLFHGEDTIFEPDIVVICDMSKLDRIYHGAPDMVVEILSPSTASKDMLLKHRKYLQAGVREYWVVDPQLKIVRVYLLKNGKYDSVDYLETGRVPVHTLEGCEIDIQKVFAD